MAKKGSWKGFGKGRNRKLLFVVILLLGLAVALFIIRDPIDIFSFAGENHDPTIVTKAFPLGRVGYKYYVEVFGYDRDRGETLEMTIADLPSGLKQGSCYYSGIDLNRSSKVSRSNTKLSCKIEGIPSEAGESEVTVTFKDGNGGEAEKVIPLKICEQGRAACK